jgi:hypothetical protein
MTRPPLRVMTAAKKLKKRVDLPLNWAKQRAQLGFD